jgi:hypothetical protein
MRWPWVSRTAYAFAVEQLALERARGDRLEATLNRMRSAGYVASGPAKVRPAPAEPEEVGLQRAELRLRKQHFVAHVREDLRTKSPGLTDVQLTAAAEDLWQKTHMLDVPG